MSELAKVLQLVSPRSRPDIAFLVYRPSAKSNWSRKRVDEAAASIAPVNVAWDDAGQEARRFGALTSGLILVYDSFGALRFRGGITGSRGHEGDNAGADLLEEALTSSPARRGTGGYLTSRVFGCALLGPETDPVSSRESGS